MAARRLLIVMLLLLGVSTLAAALVPPQRGREGIGTTETEEVRRPADTFPRGRRLALRIEVGGERRPVVPLRAGDQLSLLVASRRPGELSIPRLGLLQAVDRLAPARFEILAREPGRYPILLSGKREPVARIEVSETDGAGDSAKPERAEPRSRAPAETASA